MYQLLFWQFLRTKTCQLGLLLILILGGISLIIGKQFLNNQKRMADQVVEMHHNHVKRNVALHGDELPLLLYYLKFSLVHTTDPITGFSIGQRDLNPSVKRVTMLTLEGQKHDTDLVNPTKLLYGNLDLSFVLIYVFPLLIIAFTYNLFSEEKESGTWSIVNVMAKSKQGFLLGKLSVRLILLIAVMLFLFVVGVYFLEIPLNNTLLIFVVTSLLYVVFWFALCFCIICLKYNSNFNALALLSVWLILVVLLPALVNNYITVKYPVPEALSTMIKQRDGYHEKWDTNKKGAMVKFYEEYPQFASFGFPAEEGFDWGWYYVIQHLGDQESRGESEAMEEKILLREKMSSNWARLIPSMHTQLAFNNFAKTGLSDHMKFMEHTNTFHENIRLYFYPLIFSNAAPKDVEWNRFEPSYFTSEKSIDWIGSLMPLVTSIVLFTFLSAFLLRKVV